MKAVRMIDNGMMGTRRVARVRRFAEVMFGVTLCLLLLAGCLEQVQTTRIAGGALSNFFVHLEKGELDDAMAYFAPGLVTPSAELDSSVQDASNAIRKYEFRQVKSSEEDLDNGEKQVTLKGQDRQRTPDGQPTPRPDDGWQDTDIITARMVEIGSGWRLLDFELLCCR